MSDQRESTSRKSPEQAGGIRRVQVGCGPHHLRANWWNIDLRPFPGIDQTMDATKAWGWDSLLDYIYGEHFLEHLELSEGMAFLREAGRALRVGGRIRLTTPSLEWVLRTHFTFASNDDGLVINNTIILNRAFHGWGHKFLYSAPMLKKIFQELGFGALAFYGYGESADPELCGLELHGDYAVHQNYPSVWIIEAERLPTVPSISEEFQSYIENQYVQYLVNGH